MKILIRDSIYTNEFVSVGTGSVCGVFLGRYVRQYSAYCKPATILDYVSYNLNVTDIIHFQCMSSQIAYYMYLVDPFHHVNLRGILELASGNTYFKLRPSSQKILSKAANIYFDLRHPYGFWHPETSQVYKLIHENSN